MLVEKQRPKWQKLKLNGLGGHVELNETFVQCMARELQEEAAVALNESEFRCYAIMKGEDWTIGVFWAILDPMYFLTLTDEKVGVYSVDEVLDGTLNAVDNLPFLISKALQEAGIVSSSNYFPPIYQFPAYKRFRRGRFPNTERASKTLLALPIFYGMTDKEIHKVVSVIKSSL